MHSEQGAAGETRRLSALALISLFMAVPMCLLAVAVFAATRIFFTTSRLPAVAFVFFGCLSIASIPAAVVAAGRIRLANGALRGGLLARLGLILGIMGIVVALVLPRPVFISHQMALNSACRNHLTQIFAALVAYSNGHDNQFPGKLQILVETGTDPRLFVCPSASKRSSALDPRDVDSTGDYSYARPVNSQVPPYVPLIWDRPSNHPDGGHMCFADGAPVWLSSDKMRQTLEDARAYYAFPPTVDGN